MDSITNVVIRVLTFPALAIGEVLKEIGTSLFGPSSKTLFLRDYWRTSDAPGQIPTFHCRCGREARYGYDKKSSFYWVECKKCGHVIFAFKARVAVEHAEWLK